MIKMIKLQDRKNSVSALMVDDCVVGWIVEKPENSLKLGKYDVIYEREEFYAIVGKKKMRFMANGCTDEGIKIYGSLVDDSKGLSNMAYRYFFRKVFGRTKETLEVRTIEGVNIKKERS